VGFPAGAQDPVFRSEVRLVRLQVSVKDRAGSLVGGLSKDDFKVIDSGVPQEISVLEQNTTRQLSVSVLVDTSGSTAKDLDYEVQSVDRFFKALLRRGNPEDTAALYSFNWQVSLRSYFSRRLERLEQALHSLKGEAGTSLYDAIFLASRDMELREGRHVMVVVTDGGDTTSTKDFDSAIEQAQKAEVTLYPIVVIPIENDAGRNIGGEHALATMAARTGGRVFLPSGGEQLDRSFDDILREIRTQYLIGYYPKDIPRTKNRFHQVQVKLRKQDLQAVTRSGYYGDSER
jgi:Ca-activated chloride channel family protein